MKNINKGEIFLWIVFGIFTLISVIYLFDTGLVSALKIFIPALLVTCPPVVKKYPIRKLYIVLIAVIVMLVAIVNSDELTYSKERKQQEQKRLTEEKVRKEREDKKKELSDKKEKVTKEIREYVNLSKEEKDKFLMRVLEVNEVSEIDKIKDEAKKLDEENKNKKDKEQKEKNNAEKNESAKQQDLSKEGTSSTGTSQTAGTNSNSANSAVPQPVVTTPTGQGTIKGNRNSMIYHLPGQRDYNKIKPENTVYFETEAQAQAAGYRVAKR